MNNFWNTFLTSNETRYRLARTILQGVVGVLIANVDLLVETWNFSPEIKAFIVALVMAILSPIMSELGVDTAEPSEDYNASDADYMALFNSLDEYEEEGEE